MLRLPDRRLVFQRRTADAPRAPGLLGCFGGQVEFDETPLQAALRELTEETSIEVARTPLTYLCDLQLAESSRIDQFHIFEANIHDENFEVFEGDRAEVYARGEALDRIDLVPALRQILHNVVKE